MNEGRQSRLRVAVSAAAALLVCAAALALAGPLRAADLLMQGRAATAPIRTSTPTFRPARPYWIELTLAQREALAPLSDEWERLDSQTKKKWIEIAHRYPKMKRDEQQHTQQRMREWALLTPEQRSVARDSFARVRAMPPEQRAEMLRKYQELPDKKRKELVSEGRATKILVIPKSHVTHPLRRAQLSEGAKVKNPALAAQKSIASHARAKAAAKLLETAKPAGATSNAPATAAIPVATPLAIPGAPPVVAPATIPASNPVVAPATIPASAPVAGPATIPASPPAAAPATIPALPPVGAPLPATPTVPLGTPAASMPPATKPAASPVTAAPPAAAPVK